MLFNFKTESHSGPKGKREEEKKDKQGSKVVTEVYTYKH